MLLNSLRNFLSYLCTVKDNVVLSFIASFINHFSEWFFIVLNVCFGSLAVIAEALSAKLLCKKRFFDLFFISSLKAPYQLLMHRKCEVLFGQQTFELPWHFAKTTAPDLEHYFILGVL
jgi:hypothetical protein